MPKLRIVLDFVAGEIDPTREDPMEIATAATDYEFINIEHHVEVAVVEAEWVE